MSTKEIPGPFDALEKALPDEPMFPLLAHDPCAPATITEWCRLRRNRALRLWGGDDANAADRELLAAELAQCANAEVIALEMGDWRTGHTEVEGKRSAYQDLARSVEEVAEADRRKRREQVHRHFREAAYHTSEARDLLRDAQLMPDDGEDDFEFLLGLINRHAEGWETRRPGHEAEPALPLGAA